MAALRRTFRGLVWPFRPSARRASAGYREGVSSWESDHLRLQHAFDEAPGHWVAINRLTGDVVAIKDSPYELSAWIKRKRIRGVAILRAPAESEPEVVGFG
jgi:hypothetical protein